MTYHARIHAHKSTKLSSTDAFFAFHLLKDSQLDHDVETGKYCQLSQEVSLELVTEAAYKSAGRFLQKSIV